ncbi:MAG TPA: efflux transporter outer membrane subunit [Verrucomicrobiales bacterium]|jgi:NodT family efflux transporter outer membrane factor (OMF) lipoprotein|nr:efflux transporter outer membrane subunit [Verrucomicrobiales bacterium]
MLTRSLLLSLLVLPLAGCRVAAPGFRMKEVGVAVPGSWAVTREGKAGVDMDWVGRMGSPRLSSLVREAVAHNPDLKIAAARVDQARSLIKTAGAPLQPKLDFEMLGNKTQQNFIGLPIPGTNGVLKQTNESYVSNFKGEWELDIWGRYRAGKSAAIAAYQGAAQDERAAQAAIAAQVARAWFALIEASEQVDLAGEAMKAYQDTQESLEQRFRTGQAGDQGGLGAQLRLARSDIESARSVLEQRREAQGQAARALEILLGRYPQGDRHKSDRLPALTSPPPAGLPSELLQRRPDVLAAERRFAAQGMRQKEARRAVFPSLTLTGSLGTSTSALSKILTSDFGVWSFGAKVFEPILTGGLVPAEVQKRKAEESEALATLQKTVLKAFSEVENALEAEQLLRRREESLVEATRLAMEADSEARADFRRGLGDILTVLTTQQRAIQARSSLAAVRRLRLDNRVSLHLALGGDFRLR